MSLDKKDCIHGVGVCYLEDRLILLDKFDSDLIEIKFNFCPWCGIKLSEESILETIEEEDQDCIKGGCED